jgi:stress response protein YsnF
MVSERDVSAAIGSTAYGSDGESVGTVETFYNDDRTGATTWVALSSGLLGRRQVIAPAGDSTFADGRLQLGVPAHAVSQAPRLGGEHLTPGDEAALRQHYAQAVAQATTPAEGTAEGAGDDTLERRSDDTVGRHAGVPDASSTVPAATVPGATVPGDRDDGSMVRSEEQLRVATERVRARRVRVVKYVVTEEVQVTVPIRREEIRIEELPEGGTGDDELVTEGESLDGPGNGGTAPAGPLTGGLPDEIVLHAERPVVTVEVVPVERVRLRTEVVAGQEQVSGTLQREQVVVDQDAGPRRS